MESILIIKNDCRPLTSLMYGWSKYGGGNQIMPREDIDSTWDCQTCGSETIGEVYDFEFYPREFIKICIFCHKLSISYSISTLGEFIELVRMKHDLLEYLKEDNT